MKKYYFLPFFLLCFSFYFQSNAQHEWAPDSASWNHCYKYNWTFIPPPAPYFNRHNIETRILGDSLFQGKICRVHYRTLSFATGGSIPYDTLFTYQDSFKVYFWNEYFNHFSLLFDFNVQVGDTVLLEGVDSICPTVPTASVVDSVGTMVVNSDTLRYYVLAPSSSGWLSYGRNIEKIGNPNNYVPVSNCVFDVEGYFEGQMYCYQDPQLGLYSTGIAPTCDYILVGVEKEFPENNFRIFTHENEWMLESMGNEAFTEIHLYNLAGIREFEMFQRESNQISVPHNDLPSGIYFFRVKLGSGKWYAGKLLKE